MSAGAGTPTRVRRRRGSATHVVMVVAAALGLVLTLVALGGERDGRRVLVAARDLEAGSTVRGSDVRYETIRADQRVLTHLVGASDRGRFVGRVTTMPVFAGEPLLAAHLRPRAADDGRRAMSIPVARARAVNGRLVPGDRVDVVVADRDGAAVVAAGLEVLDVDRGEGGAFGARRGEVSVTLAVDVGESQVLAAALAGGEFVLTRVTGATPAVASPPAVSGGTSR